MQKHENDEVFQPRKVERLSIKIGKAELDIKFLPNCMIFNVIPSLNLPCTNEVDSNLFAKDYCEVR